MKGPKTTYEIDPHNRLVLTKKGKSLELPRFRKVLDGRFRIDESGILTYHVKESQDSRVPQQIKLSGDWSLDKSHNLILTLDKWHGGYASDKLTIKGEIIDAQADKMVFGVTTKDASNKTIGYILELGGVWQADKYNRLSFNVKKEQGAINSLVLQGEWDINKHNQIIYTYAKESLKTKEKLTQTITLKGYWDITEKHRLLYVLNKEKTSQFNFKVSLGEGFNRGLRYELGIGAIPKKKEITLFGAWKVNDRLELIFETEYKKGVIQDIIFSGTCSLDDNYYFDFKLKTKQGRDLGLNLKLSKKILKDQGEIFLQGLVSKQEKQIILGGGWRW